MAEAMTQLLAVLAGGMLGAIFYGGLWWTVRSGLASARPARLFVGSLLLRLSVTLTGFYFVANGDWKRLLLCLLGFIAGRLIVTWVTSRKVTQQPRETPHATHSR